MLRRLLLIGCFLALVVSGPVQAQVGLEWKFKEGDQFFLESVTATKQSMELLGMKTPGTDVENTTVTSYKVMKKSADSAVLQLKIESVKVKNNGAQLGPLSGLMEKSAGAVLTATINNKGEVTKLEGFPELLRKLAGDDENVGKLLRLVVTEDLMRESIEEALAFLPGKPVSMGDTWQRKGSLTMGPLGRFEVDRTFTSVGKSKDGETLTVKGAYKYQPPKAEGGLPFKVSKGDFKTEEAKGQVIFDADAGRLVRSEYKLRLKGTLTLMAGDQTIPAEVQMEMSYANRALKELPK